MGSQVERSVADLATTRSLSIDSRLFRASRRVSIPLHPSETAILAFMRSLVTTASEVPIREFVASAFGVCTSQTFLGHRSSGLLALFFDLIKEIDRKPFVVGIPSFCCPAPLAAIINADCVPRFYDIDVGFEISAHSREALSHNNIRAIIVPSYFGKHRRPTDWLDRAKSPRTLIIRDDVHAFPSCYGDLHWDVALASFHPSKRLPGLGGGAIAIRDRGLAELFQAKLRAHTRWTTLRQSSTNSFLKHSARFALRQAQKAIPFASALDSKRTNLHQSWQDSERAAEAHLAGRLQPQPLPHVWARYINAILPQSSVLMARSVRHFQLLAQVVSKALGPEALAYMQHLEDSPTHFVLKVDPARRFQLGQSLTDQGVECSWLYYPLHRLARFSILDDDQFPTSIALARSTLLIPFNAAHSDQQIEQLCRALLRACDSI